MRYYLLRKRIEFVVYKVKDELVFDFLDGHHSEVLLEAASLVQLLILFEREWLFDLEYSG